MSPYAITAVCLISIQYSPFTHRKCFDVCRFLFIRVKSSLNIVLPDPNYKISAYLLQNFSLFRIHNIPILLYVTDIVRYAVAERYD